MRRGRAERGEGDMGESSVNAARARAGRIIMRLGAMGLKGNEVRRS